MLHFAIGIISVAVLMGFMVGASSSPVSGIAITAIFGLMAGTFAYAQQSRIGDPDTPSSKTDKSGRARAMAVDTLNALGRVLVCFTLAFTVGLAVGIWAKANSRTPTAPGVLPWSSAASAPASARDALDWIIVQKNLKAMGYDDTQVQFLYKLDTEKLNQRGGGFVEAPLSNLFSSSKVERTPEHLIANQPPPDPATIFRQPFSPISPTGPKGTIG